MFLHLLEADHADAGLDSLRRQVFQPPFRWDSEEDLTPVAQEADGSPSRELDAGSGAERSGHLRDLAEAELGQGVGESSQDLVDATGRADGPPARQALRD